MKSKTIVLLVIAGGCGLMAMLGVQQAMQGAPAPARVESAKVLVALTNIETGMPLNSDSVAFRSMPVGSLPEDPVRTEEEYAQRAALVPLMPGDIVRKQKLTGKGEYGKSVTIPKGWRVIGISVDDTKTNSGLLRPGDRVDVLITYLGRNDRGAQIQKTKTLLEYIEVFATDERTATKAAEQKESNRSKTVSLVLSPDQVHYAPLAQRKGALSLAWRNRADDELVQTRGVDDKLLEELEGTVGIHEDHLPLYGENLHEFAEEPEPGQEEETSASQFLSSVNLEQPQTVAAPPADLWTVEIYQGNTPVAHNFSSTTSAVPDSKTDVQPTAPQETMIAPLNAAAEFPVSESSWTDLMKSFWGGGKTPDIKGVEELLK